VSHGWPANMLDLHFIFVVQICSWHSLHTMTTLPNCNTQLTRLEHSLGLTQNFSDVRNACAPA